MKTHLSNWKTILCQSKHVQKMDGLFERKLIFIKNQFHNIFGEVMNRKADT